MFGANSIKVADSLNGLGNISHSEQKFEESL